MARLRSKGYGPRRDLADSGGVVGFECFFSDGAATIENGDWEPLSIQSTIGEAGAITGNTITIAKSGNFLWEGRGEILLSWGESVIFGASLNGGTINEIGRAVCNSSDYLFVITPRRSTHVAADTVVEFYISSTFQYGETAWRNLTVTTIVPR